MTSLHPSAGAPKPLGEILLERTLISAEDLERCVARQRERQRQGSFVRLGDVIVDEGLLTAEEIAKALEAQDLTILVCERCDAQFNVELYKDTMEYPCLRCRGRLRKPESLSSIGVEDTFASQEMEAFDPTELEDQSGVVEAAARHDGIAWFGPYEIMGEISRGGMSVVYKARQPQLDRFVALKVLIGQKDASEEDLTRFQREARAISRLRHPNIVGIFEVGKIGGIEFFTMDFIEGVTLDRAVVLEGLGPEDIALIFEKICQALHFADSRGILHRDLKPKNILLDRHGEPVIIDFGIAKADDDSSVSGEHEILGSPAYLAPEYVTGESDYNIRCEIYSLGTSLYQLLSGRNPNDDIDTRRILENAGTRQIAPLRKVASNVPSSLASIVMTAVATDPQHRYANFAELARDLRRFLDGEEVHTVSSPLMMLWRRVRLKALLVIFGMLCIALVFSSGYYARVISSQDDSLESLKSDRNLWQSAYCKAQRRYIEELLNQNRKQEAKKQARALFRKCPELANSEAFADLRQRLFKSP